MNKSYIIHNIYEYKHFIELTRCISGGDHVGAASLSRAARPHLGHRKRKFFPFLFLLPKRHTAVSSVCVNPSNICCPGNHPRACPPQPHLAPCCSVFVGELCFWVKLGVSFYPFLSPAFWETGAGETQRHFVPEPRRETSLLSLMCNI